MLRKLIKSKVVGNSSVYFLASVLRMGVPFFLLPVLTRYLSTEDYGILATFQAFIMIFSVIIGQNVAAAVSVNYFHLNKEELKKYSYNVYLLIGMYFLGVLAVVFLLRGLIEKWLHIPGDWMAIVVCIAFFDGLSFPMLNFWRADKKPVPFGSYQVLQTTLNVILTLILVILCGMKWQGRLLAIVSACFVFDVILVWIIMKGQYVKRELNQAYLKDAFLYGAPLIPHMLSGALIGTIDRIFITSMVGLAATGLYTVGYQIGMIMDLIGSSANQAVYPFLFERFKRNKEEDRLTIVKATYLYDLGILMMGVLVCLCAPLIIKYFVGKEFQDSVQFVRWIAVGYVFKGFYYIRVHYLFYNKKTHLLAVCTMIGALTSVVCNYFLIKANGAIGAAQANVISFAVWASLTWALAARVHPMPWFYFLKRELKYAH